MPASVERIELVGAPTTIVVDPAALGPSGQRDGAAARTLLDALGLRVKVLGVDPIDASDHAVAVLGRPARPIDRCDAWFVGAGPTPAWMHATDGGGPRTTVLILSLLAAGFAQVRAGAAFVAAGSGQPEPMVTGYDRAAVLAGITDAVRPTGGELPRCPDPPRIDDAFIDASLRSSLALLDRCCGPTGAIAAAPPATHAGEPDYGFFWQRDAAHAAYALHQLSMAAPDEAGRHQAQARLDAYVHFVAALGRRLADAGAVGISRTSLAGVPIDGYGNPQPDGPAATALVLLAVVPDPREALVIARPFLAHLRDHEPVGYDLWELTFGTSFPAVNLARRALSRAAGIARRVADPDASRYARAAAAHAALLESFRAPSGGVVATLDPQPSFWSATSRLDVSVIGSAVFAGAELGTPWAIDDPAIVATLHELERAFARRWPINVAWRAAGHRGGGLGRFPEDCNDGVGATGGHPWPIATLWAAQLHYARAQSVTADATRTEARAQADGYLAFVLAHADPAAASEQIDGQTGAPRGARGLAWTHAELVATLSARRETLDDPATTMEG